MIVYPGYDQIAFISQAPIDALLKYQSVKEVQRMDGKVLEGKYGVQYLDYKVLGDILEETEPELIAKVDADIFESNGFAEDGIR